MKGIILIEILDDTQGWLKNLLNGAFDTESITSEFTESEALVALNNDSFELAMNDLSFPDGGGAEILERIQQISPGTPLAVTTILVGNKYLLSALKTDAQGYLLKDQSEERLLVLFKGLVHGVVPFWPSLVRRMLRYINRQEIESTEVDTLTAREKEVLRLIAKGISHKEAARLLGISPHTVGGYTKDIYLKLNVNTRAEATIEAIRMGLIAI